MHGPIPVLGELPDGMLDTDRRLSSPHLAIYDVHCLSFSQCNGLCVN